MGIRPIKDWPLLICGPILRRVTETSVAVFVATSAACEVKIRVTQADNFKPVGTSQSQKTRQLGGRLHIAVCQLRVSGADVLQPGIVYQYDVQMTPGSPGAPVQTLADQAGLLTGEEPLGYADGALPTFAVSPEVEKLHIIHSSCRKPHGGGPDALAIADTLVKLIRTDPTVVNTLDDALARPHQLLLTGDQIYADDVALVLLENLIAAGQVLLGPSEAETFSPGNLAFGHQDLRPGWARGNWLVNNSMLSSEYGMNHLMFFAEFCAMYMMCWSDELWERNTDATGKTRLLVGEVDRISAFPESLAVKQVNRDWQDPAKVIPAENGNRNELISFVRSLRRVRRVLANIPTTMIFDDHEISDDWNLDGEWAENARKDPALHRIVRNGLLAYAAFQGWGNSPDAFSTSVGKELLDEVSVVSGNTPPFANDRTKVDSALNIAAAGPTDPAKRINWDWSVDGTTHRVIALDSRTRRDYTSAGPTRAGLLTPDELKRQLIDLRPATANVLSFVIAPGPVTGHPLVEEIGQPAFAAVKGGRAADHESWSVNRLGFEALLAALAGFGRVIVLSGDVHYAFTNHTAYFGAKDLPPARIVQLCASSAKNREKKTQLIGIAGFLGLESRGWFGLPQVLDSKTKSILRDSLRAAVEQMLSAIPPPVLKFFPPNPLVAAALRIRRLYFDLIVSNRLESPTVIPAGPWYTDSTVTLVRNLVSQAGKDSWCYKISYLSDLEKPEMRIDNAVALGLAVQFPFAAPTIAGLVGERSRSVIGDPCIGLVTFSSDAEKVIHTIIWNVRQDGGRPSEESKVVQFLTRHVAPLKRPDISEMPTIFRVGS